MERFAQILSWGFVLVLGSAGLATMLFPGAVNEPAGFNAVTDYGLTNVRTLGAPTLALAIFTAIGAIKREWLFLLPASLYFLLNGSARVISVFVEGYEPVMLTGLVLTFSLFGLSQLALHTFRVTVHPSGRGQPGSANGRVISGTDLRRRSFVGVAVSIPSLSFELNEAEYALVRNG